MKKCPHCTTTLNVRRFLSGRAIMWRAKCPNGSCPYAITERVAASKAEAADALQRVVINDPDFQASVAAKLKAVLKDATP